MRVTRTVRLASNPKGKKRSRKLTPKQIRHFGTRRQKSALKAANKRKRTRTARNAPPKRRVTVAPRAKRSTKRNPLVLHLKPMQSSNPKRRNSMTKPKRKRKMKNTRRRVARVSNRRRTRRTSNPRRAHRRAAPRRQNRRRTRNRRRNATTRVVVMAPRRNSHRRRGRRNPNLFGNSLGSKNSLMILGGGLAGVAAAKFIPTLIPSSLTAGLGTSTFGPFIISGVSTLAAWWLASKINAPFGEGVLFGGLMQTASVALNAFLPGFTIAGVPIALSGFGDLVSGRFAVPQNPLRGLPGGGAPTHAMAPTGSKVTTSGLGRAYPSAY